MNKSNLETIKVINDSGLFEPEWYASRYPDVSLSRIPPLEHFIRFGSLLLRNPCPLFDSRYYCSQLPKNESPPQNPLLHYIQSGWKSNINPNPLFDLRWYLEQNPDISMAGIEPLFHFYHQGGYEGRMPHAAFPTHKILEKFPHLAEQKINPLEFYLSNCRDENLSPETTDYLNLLAEQSHTENHSPLIERFKKPSARIIIPNEKYEIVNSPITDVRAIAIYLPQYHAIPENDEWWGKGFTEWTSVRRATPQYAGHYQPHIPHPDIGYYDLNDAAVLEKQAAMARSAGIEGFCFYYYWFNGRRLLNMPTDRLLATGKPDFPFCFCWANENWTRTWDGGDKEILMGQEHSDESDERFILDLLPAFRDPRYIRVGGKPLLIVYRPGLLPDPAATARHWREICRREGIGEIFLARMQMFDWELEGRDPGYDTVIQFPPVSRGFSSSLKTTLQLHDPKSFVGEIYDYRLTAGMYPSENIGKNLWPGVCPSWDNTPRRMERGHSWTHSSPEIYHRWLSNVADRARKALPPQQRFVFINAWNEWAEGCHLEPDVKHGYAWLNATRLALTNNEPPTPPQPRRRVLVVGHDAAQAGAQIVLLAMLREWRAIESWDFQLVLLRDGVLRHDFEAICETLVLTDHNNETLQKQAFEKFCRNAPDVILGNTVVIGPFLPSLKHLGVPIISYVHELQKSIERWAPGPIMQATVEYSDHFIAVSEPVAQNLTLNHGISRAQISCLNPYIKTSHTVTQEQLNALRNELSLQPEDKVVFGCGTMDWRKGPDLFTQTAIEVLQKVPEARFIWLGHDTGDEAAARAHQLAANPRIQFLGERSNPRDYLALGHAFFLSSREDPFPLVALEAADAGLPVVCFADAGGMPEFVNDTCGSTVPFENTKAAAKSLIQLLTDELLRETLGQNAKTSVRAKHDSTKGAAAVLSVLNGLCETTKQKPSPNKSSQQCAAAKPLVSVIVPNYNHARFLPKRLESITRQTLSDFELILMDDFSTDESLEVLRAFAAREPRARLVLNSENSGSTFKQWHKGLAEAKGKYIWIAESDDFAEPTLLETLVGRLESNPAAVLAACCPFMVDIEGKDLGIPTDWFKDIGGWSRWERDFTANGTDELRRVLLHKNSILNASGVVFRNLASRVDLIETEMRLCADWLYWSRLLTLGDFEYVGRPLNFWRLGSSSARTKLPGETEWLEGSKVIREIAANLGINAEQTDLLIQQFKKRCNNWSGEVTVVVPNYNCAPFLQQRLESIAGQSHKPKEIIILDDASTDRSLEIANRFAESSPIPCRIVCNEKNSGSPYVQWQRGLLEAATELVWIAEADDYADEHFLKALCPHFIDHKLVLAYCQTLPVNEKGEPFPSYFGTPLFPDEARAALPALNSTDSIDKERWIHSYRVEGADEIAKGLGFQNTIPNGSAILVRRGPALDAIAKSQGLRNVGDWVFYLELAKEGKVAYEPAPMNFFRRHRFSTTQSNPIQVLRESLGVTLSLIEEGHLPLNAAIDSIYRRFLEYDWELRSEAGRPRLHRHSELSEMAERLRAVLLGLMPPDNSPSILFLLPDADTGGGQTAAVRLANELAKTHRVFLVNARPLLDDGNLAKMLSNRVALLEGRLHTLAHLRYSTERPNPTETDLSPIRVSALSSLCDWLGIEIVFSHVWWADKLAHALVKSTPMRWFLHMHGCYEFLIDSGHSDPLHDREICNFPDLARDIFQRVHGVLYLDEKNLAVFERLKIPRPPLRLACNGFEDPEPLQQTNGHQRLCDQLDEIVFCMCARGIPEKGWEQAITATRRVNRLPANQRGNKKARLVTIGSSDYLDKLLDKHSDAPEITHIGLQESPIETMRKCQVGLLPTYFVSESQPNVVIEYMAACLAVISTAIGTIPQMLADDGLQAGVALPCGDKAEIEDGLVEEMARLMREGQELEKRREHAREIFERKYHIRTIAGDLMEFFKDSTRKSEGLRNCLPPQLNQSEKLYFHVNKTIKKTGVIGIDLDLISKSLYSNALSLCGNNTGNILFNYSAYSQVIYGNFIGYYFNEQINHINLNMSSLIIPAANWINTANDWGFLANLLEKTTIPICCVGLGSQNSIHEIDTIPSGTVAFLKVLQAKTKLIGVRGFQTKAILEKIGIFNTEVVGCPSILNNFFPVTNLIFSFDHNNPRLSISFTRYTRRDPDPHGCQRQLAQLAAQFSNSIVLQSEEAEICYLEKPDAETAAWLCSYYNIDESKLPRLVTKLQFFNSQKSWVQFHRDNTDFTISSRIHGCVASLLAGKPALLLAHDQRTSELAETMGIPQRPIECVNHIRTKDDLLDLIRDLDYSDFFDKQLINLEKLKHLYKTCGVATSISD